MEVLQFDPASNSIAQLHLEPPDRKKQSPGVPKFSTLAKLAEQLPTPANAPFNRNAVNRLWFILFGRGLIHPLDLDHSKNPPSHPEVLDLLAGEGYSCFEFTPAGPVPLARMTDATEGTNFLFLHTERHRETIREIAAS